MRTLPGEDNGHRGDRRLSNTIFPSLIKGITWTVLRTPTFSTIEQLSSGYQATRVAQYRNPVWKWQLVWDYLYGNWPGPNNTMAYGPWTDISTLMGFFLARRGKFSDFLYVEPSDFSVGPALVSTSPNAQAELQVVTDGAGHYFSPVQRSMGGMFSEDITDLNPIAPAAGAISVYANGSSQTYGVDYTLAGPGLAIPGYSATGLYLAWSAPLPWLPNWAYSSGTQILDPNGFIQQVTTPGTSGADEPVFNTTVSGTTTGDGGVTWTNEDVNAPPASPVTAAFNFYFRVTFDGDEQDFEQTMQQLWTIGGGRSKNGNGYLKLITSRPHAANVYNTGAGFRLIYGAGTCQITWTGSTVVNVVMDGQGNATIQFISGTTGKFYGIGNVQLIEGGTNNGPVSLGTSFTLGEELAIQEWDGGNKWFTGPASRNSDSTIHATLAVL